jgi:transporter family protein
MTVAESWDEFMWIVFAFGSAVFAGLTAILAKCGIRKTDSDAATAIRTIVVLIFSWIMVMITGSIGIIGSLSSKTWIFLVLSGIATGASWLCYFKALQFGDVNKVVPIDKSSTILTIILAFIFLGEPITLVKGISVVLIGVGTFMMIQKKETADEPEKPKGCSWLIYALLSTVFASLTAILGKVGIEGVESNLGTAIRTCVVLVMAWVVVFVKGKQHTIREIPKNELGFICLSGLATGGSWLCYYRALHDGMASVVVPIDKLSILVSIAFSYIVFRERLTKKAVVGLCLIVAGTLIMLL